MSEAQISGSTQYFNEYSDEVTYYMAEGCLEESMIRIEDDISFSGTTLPLQDGTCEIYVSGSAIKSIDINVTYLNYSQAFMAEVTVSNNGTANNARLISWKKV